MRTDNTCLLLLTARVRRRGACASWKGVLRFRARQQDMHETSTGTGLCECAPQYIDAGDYARVGAIQDKTSNESTLCR